MKNIGISDFGNNPISCIPKINPALVSIRECNRFDFSCWFSHWFIDLTISNFSGPLDRSWASRVKKAHVIRNCTALLWLWDEQRAVCWEIMTVVRRAGDRRHSYTAALPDNITKLALDILRSSLLLRWIQDLFPKAVHVKQSWSALLRELSSSEKAKTFARIVSLQHKNTARWKLHVIFFAC